jgi:hypothetical protein
VGVFHILENAMMTDFIMKKEDYAVHLFVGASNGVVEAAYSGHPNYGGDFFDYAVLSRETHTWCKENLISSWHLSLTAEMWFKSEYDAVLFKLRWL